MKNKMTDLMMVCKTIIEICVGMKAGEELLILADTSTDFTIIEAFREAGNNAGVKVSTITRTPPTRPHDLPTSAVEWAMKGVNVIIDVSRYDILHTLPIRKALLDYGARLIIIPGHTPETLTAPNIAEVDYEKIHEKASKLVKVLETGCSFRYSNPKGTDLRADIRGRSWYALDGIAHDDGSIAVIPVGEVLGSAVPGTPYGTIVLDYLATFGKLKTPIILTVENGWVTKIKGGEEADRLRGLWANIRNANYIGELGGIALNPLNKLSGRMDTVEESMKLGAAHIGFGDSLTYGDRVSSKLHLNGTMLDITVEVDGRTVVSNNQILV